MIGCRVPLIGPGNRSTRPWELFDCSSNCSSVWVRYIQKMSSSSTGRTGEKQSIMRSSAVFVASWQEYYTCCVVISSSLKFSVYRDEKEGKKEASHSLGGESPKYKWCRQVFLKHMPAHMLLCLASREKWKINYCLVRKVWLRDQARIMKGMWCSWWGCNHPGVVTSSSRIITVRNYSDNKIPLRCSIDGMLPVPQASAEHAQWLPYYPTLLTAPIIDWDLTSWVPVIVPNCWFLKRISLLSWKYK